jgi:hypothetical protein
VTRYRIEPGSSQVGVVVALSIGTISMAAREISGELDAEMTEHGVFLTVTQPACRLEVPVHALHSGNPLLDREGRRRFDAQHFPLVVAELVGAVPRSAGDHFVTWRLTLHGQTHDLDGEMRVLARDADSFVASGSEMFDVRDWGFTPGGYLGVKVRPHATFSVDLLAVDTSADAAAR